MSKKDKGITNIKYGELHLFYPIRFEKNISIEELWHKIQKSSIVFNKDYEKVVLDQLANDMHKLTQEWNQEYGEFMHTRVVDYEKVLNKDIPLSERRKGDFRIEIYMQNGKMYQKLVSTELEALQERHKQMKAEYEHSSQIYGNGFTNMQDRFLLLPLKVTLYNGEIVWLYSYLYLFFNHMAILKLEIPLVDVNIDALKDNELDDYIQATTCTWDENVESFTSIASIESFYKKKILENNIEFIALDSMFRHYILADFEDMPTRIDNLSIALQEDIFRIVCAPAPNIPASIRRDAEELLKNYSYGQHNMRSVLKSTGGCFTFVDKEFLEYCASLELQQTLSSLDEADRKYLSCEVVRNVEFNVEFAILIIILKKMNQHIDLWQKLYKLKELNETKKEYLENVIFITSLQENCYGSVHEQVETFEKMLPYYMQTDLMTEKLNAVEGILTIQDNEKKDKLQVFITVGGFLIAAIFGLPSIYDALGILRESLWFIPYNIPIVSQENVSVLIWLGLNAWLCWNLFERFRNEIIKVCSKLKSFLQKNTPKNEG